MYKDGFVVSIMRDDRPQRESGRTVRIPFGSEYKIRLKNKNDKNCKAVVTIDGTPVSQMGSFVLSPGGTLDLERFVTDSLSKGKKFKFVSAKDSRVQDPTSSENGVVRVEFYKAKNGPLLTQEDWTWYKPVFDYDGTYDDSQSDGSTGTWKGKARRTIYTNNTSGVYACNVSFTANNYAPPEDRGATVEGGESFQTFQAVADFETESAPVVIELELRAPRDSVTPEPERNYCGECGARRRNRDKYCPQCGRKF